MFVCSDSDYCSSRRAAQDAPGDAAKEAA
jgi:alpha-D-ribose 1-methylphosphonate 5-phosphate C-P lyase